MADSQLSESPAASGTKGGVTSAQVPPVDTAAIDALIQNAASSVPAAGATFDISTPPRNSGSVLRQPVSNTACDNAAVTRPSRTSRNSGAQRAAHSHSERLCGPTRFTQYVDMNQDSFEH